MGVKGPISASRADQSSSMQASKTERLTERLTPWFSLLGVIGFVVAIVLALCTGCGPQPVAAVSMSMSYDKQTPPDASVSIDEQYIGPLGYVAAHGVRLPE